MNFVVESFKSFEYTFFNYLKDVLTGFANDGKNPEAKDSAVFLGEIFDAEHFILSERLLNDGKLTFSFSAFLVLVTIFGKLKKRVKIPEDYRPVTEKIVREFFNLPVIFVNVNSNNQDQWRVKPTKLKEYIPNAELYLNLFDTVKFDSFINPSEKRKKGKSKRVQIEGKKKKKGGKGKEDEDEQKKKRKKEKKNE